MRCSTLICSLLVLGLLHSGEPTGDSSTKDSPKSRKRKTVQVDSATLPPSKRTHDDWLALKLDDVKQACVDVGLSPEGTVQALANRLMEYYADLAYEQQILASQTNNQDDVEAAIREHEELMAQCNAAMDKVVEAQRQSGSGGFARMRCVV